MPKWTFLFESRAVPTTTSPTDLFTSVTFLPLFLFPRFFLKKRITVIQREKERLKKRTPRLILLLSHLSDSSSLARISSCVNVLLTRPHSWSSCYLLRLHGTDHFFFSLFFSLFLILLPDTKPPGHHCRHQWQYSNSVPKDMPTPQTVS